MSVLGAVPAAARDSGEFHELPESQQRRQSFPRRPADRFPSQWQLSAAENFSAVMIPNRVAAITLRSQNILPVKPSF